MFFIVEYGIDRFLCATRVGPIRSSGIILNHPLGYTFVPNFVSGTPSIAEIAHGEYRVINQSLTQSITHLAYLMCREPKLLLQNKKIYTVYKY